MQLTTKQLAEFDKNGFIVLRKFLDVQSCDDILEVAKRHLSQHIEPIETELGYNTQSKASRTENTDYASAGEPVRVVRRLRQVYTRDVLFKSWMENENIRPILQQVLDDQVVLTTAHHNSIMTKMPYVSSPTSWHQDRRYWRYSDDNLVSVWLALDDETQDNGVLEFIPASHKMDFKSEQFDEKEYFSLSHENNKKIIETKMSTDLQKGDVVLFNSLLLHRANKNSTSNAKISFVYTVKGRKTKAIKGSRSAEFLEISLDII
jgi:phytanoyl-CoA hydroxylase